MSRAEVEQSTLQLADPPKITLRAALRKVGKARSKIRRVKQIIGTIYTLVTNDSQYNERVLVASGSKCSEGAYKRL